MLLTEQLLVELGTIGVNELVFSIDSLDEEKFNFLRRGANFFTVVNNFIRASQIKGGFIPPTPRLGITFSVNTSNYREIPEMIRFIKDNNADFIGIIPFVKGPTNPPLEELSEESLKNYRELINAAVNKEPNDIELRVAPGLQFGEQDLKLSYNRDFAFCKAVYGMMYIQPNGKVRPCCCNGVILGDLDKQSLREIWNGEGYQNLRRGFIEGTLTEQCKKCVDGLKFIFIEN
jgi:MoaA/NifB/PqqE/SkfB family radical SAM enzyme